MIAYSLLLGDFNYGILLRRNPTVGMLRSWRF